MSASCSAADAVLVSALRHLAKVRGQLLAASRGEDDPIHDVRKALKQARASLRLFRGCVARKDLARANRRLRQIGQGLRDARDAQAFTAVYDALLEGDSEATSRTQLEQVKAVLASHQAREIAAIRRRQGWCKASAERLDRVGLQLQSWVGVLASRHLRKSLRHQFRKTREAYRVALQAPTAENLHEWRKQLKYLRNAAGDLPQKHPKHFDRVLKTVDDLAELLGDDHDLIELEDWLSRVASVELSTTDRDALHALITSRRGHINRHTWPLAERLFCISADEFARAALGRH